MLLANDALHVFDPLQNVVATDKSNGKKWSLEKLEREGFNHMLTPFAQLKDWPTIFRLPLRRNCSSSWKTALCTWTEESLQSLLDSFSGRMHVEERLVLAKHVRSVTFSVKRNESFEPKAKFECGQLTEAHKLMQSLPKTLAEVQALISQPKHHVSEMTIHSTVGGATIQSKWVVSHALEADAALFALAEAQSNAGVALLPHGAAAYCLTAPKDYRGHWCCQLPLSELTTGLPLMVHSFFNLSTSRKMIPVPPATPSPFRSNTQQEMWNDALLRGPVASSLAQLIMHCRNLARCGNLAHFFS